MSIIIMPYNNSWHVWCLYGDGKATVIDTTDIAKILAEAEKLISQYSFKR